MKTIHILCVALMGIFLSACSSTKSTTNENSGKFVIYLAAAEVRQHRFTIVKNDELIVLEESTERTPKGIERRTRFYYQ